MPVTWCYQLNDGQQHCSTGFPMGCYVHDATKDNCMIGVMDFNIDNWDMKFMKEIKRHRVRRGKTSTTCSTMLIWLSPTTAASRKIGAAVLEATVEELFVRILI